MLNNCDKIYLKWFLTYDIESKKRASNFQYDLILPANHTSLLHPSTRCLPINFTFWKVLTSI